MQVFSFLFGFLFKLNTNNNTHNTDTPNHDGEN